MIFYYNYRHCVILILNGNAISAGGMNTFARE